MKIEMTIPTAIYLECPSCGTNTLHEVLRGRVGGKKETLEATVRCRKCGTVHTTLYTEMKPLRIPVIVSDLGKSQREEIELGPDELITIGDELIVGDTQVVVTSIESGEKRMKECVAREIGTIWAKRFDRVKVKISINKGSKTIPAEMLVPPDEEFYVGDLLTIGKYNVVVHNIKTKDRMLRDGGSEAREIVRIYAKIVRTTNA
ncbi:MAG: HVO_0476 family zinc finger protein [Methanomassiliicoccales archaeon]|nr:HVO_0476 family zinc finger protein [Methanomassiliicoccales archaeon]